MSDRSLRKRSCRDEPSQRKVQKRKLNKPRISSFTLSKLETEEYEPTVFDNLNEDCMNEILDWLPLHILCGFGKTSKSLLRTVKRYYLWKYPSHELEIGDEFAFHERRTECCCDIVQCLRLYDSNIVDFGLAEEIINKNLRELEFDRTYKQDNAITKQHIDRIPGILKNVKTVRAINCEFDDGCFEYLLENCKSIEDFAFTVYRKRNTFKLRNFPTIRNIEIHFDAKANVTDAMQRIKEENWQINELGLLFRKEHHRYMDSVFKDLDWMQERKFFKRLFLMFTQKLMVTEHIGKLASMQCLEGITCDYAFVAGDESHLADLSKCHSVKFVYILWLLVNADQFAQKLQQLDELEIPSLHMDVIVSFVRYSPTLTKFHISRIRPSNDCKVRFDAEVLTRIRSTLSYARRIVFYMPEDKYLSLKRSGTVMSTPLIEFKREESYIPLRKVD